MNITTLDDNIIARGDKCWMGHRPMLYKKPIVLNSVAHRMLRVAPVRSYGFAKNITSCALLGTEFKEATKSYPIVFMKNDDVMSPVVLFGIMDNSYIDESGAWMQGTYVPAYIRRYPYIMSEVLGRAEMPTLCVDSEYEGYDAQDGERLYTDEGANTPLMERTLDLLGRFNAMNSITLSFTSRLMELELFKPINVSVMLADGKMFVPRGVFMVDEKALIRLPDADVISMTRKGWFGWIYAHLFSLSKFRRMLDLMESDAPQG